MTTRARHTITRAICRHADGSRTGGIGKNQLPFPVMRFNVNFPATDHSEVASDADSFARLFPTYYCKALSRAFIIIKDFHKHEVLSTESKERLVTEYSTSLSKKNRTPTHNEINVLLYLKHESLPPLDLILYYGCKSMNFFLICKSSPQNNA